MARGGIPDAYTSHTPCVDCAHARQADAIETQGKQVAQMMGLLNSARSQMELVTSQLLQYQCMVQPHAVSSGLCAFWALSPEP